MVDSSRTWSCSGTFRRSIAVLFIAIMLASAGCPGTDPDVPPDDNGDPTDVTAGEIVSPSTGFGVSIVDPPVSVLYTVPDSATAIEGFYVPVADGSPGSTAIGDPQVVVVGLSPGTNRAFSLDPQETGLGFFRVGITYVVVDSDGAQLSMTVESTAAIQVQDSPDPAFVQPADGVTSVPVGADLLVSFDAGDPEDIVQWRLFLLSETDPRDAPADALGMPLAVGSGNVGTFTLQTDDLPPGLYQLGVSATDSGSSISQTVALGESSRIITIPNDSTTTPFVEIVP